MPTPFDDARILDEWRRYWVARGAGEPPTGVHWGIVAVEIAQMYQCSPIRVLQQLYPRGEEAVVFYRLADRHQELLTRVFADPSEQPMSVGRITHILRILIGEPRIARRITVDAVTYRLRMHSMLQRVRTIRGPPFLYTKRRDLWRYDQFPPRGYFLRPTLRRD